MIYTYSPNWYKPQCLHFTNNYLYYCSNYILYEYNLTHKQVERQLCFRQVALQYNLNHKDIKINAIASSQHQLLVGLNQPYLAILDRATLQIIKMVAIDSFQSIQYIHQYSLNNLDYAILCNRDGNMLKFAADQQHLAISKIQIKHKLSGVKAIYSIDDYHCAVFTRGTILVYNSDFSKLQKLVEVSSNDTIFSVDCFKKGDKNYFAFLTRNKDAFTFTTFQFRFNEQFPLEFKKKIQEIGINIVKFDVNIYYPKKFAQKLKMSQKASLTIKMMDKDRVILTGKLGQIVTLHLQHIKSGTNLMIKPFSMQQNEQKQYQIWTDGKHYKQIYFIYQHDNRMYIISTDHTLTVWLNNYQEKTVKYIYSIKFLTAPIQSLFYSESDPRNIFTLLKDSVVRSFTPLDEGSHQLNQYWKFTKKYKIKKAINHPNQQGILGLVTECNKILIYDAFEDRLMKIIQINEQILNISFEYPSIRKELQLLMKYQFKEQKYQSVSHFVKEMDNQSVLLVQTKTNLIVISNVGDKQIVCFKGLREKRLQRIHENRYWNQKLLLTSRSSKNNGLDLFIRFNSHSLQTQIQLKYQQGRILFKSPKNSNQLIVVNFKGSKFTIYKLKIDEQKKQIALTSTVEVCLQNPIDYFNINYHDWRVAIYSQRDDAITVVQLDKLTEEKYQISKNSQQAVIYWINMKIDSLCFYLQDYLILATKDQAIKVVSLAELEELKKQHKKKNGYITKVGTVQTPNNLSLD